MRSAFRWLFELRKVQRRRTSTSGRTQEVPASNGLVPHLASSSTAQLPVGIEWMKTIYQRHVYQCFTCGSAGNQLDLYAAITGRTVFEAAVALCELLHQEIPWVQRR